VTLEGAARGAFERAAPDAAAELLELSLRLTPPELTGEVRRRHLDAGRSHLAAGDVTRGIEHLEEALSISSEGADRAEALWLLAGTAATSGDVARSARLIGDALEQPEVPSPLQAAMLAELSLDEWEMGDPSAAAKAARGAIRSAADEGSPGDPAADMRVGRSRAIAHMAKDDPDAAIASLARALRGIDTMPPSVELGRTLLMLGTLRRRNRQKASARDALQTALEVFGSIGASAWTERATSEMARIGGRPPARGELTPTEHRVAALAAAGRTNREIADTLFTSVRTVEGHLSHIYAKLGIRSRTELAVFFEPPEDRSQP
jgi:DNA-binding NarL/FixJ family response regulator